MKLSQRRAAKSCWNFAGHSSEATEAEKANADTDAPALHQNGHIHNQAGMLAVKQDSSISPAVKLTAGGSLVILMPFCSTGTGKWGEG